ncbi:MAG: hypothetical protein AAFR74_01700 [Pseudomonadota bacterium]
MEEKRKDLTAERQKKLIQTLLEKMSAGDPNFYYLSTSQVAMRLHDYIRKGAKLPQEDSAIMMPLTQKDLQVLLSYK